MNSIYCHFIEIYDFAKGWITLINEGTIMYIIDVDAPIMYIIIRTTMMHKKLLLHRTKK